MSTVEKIIEENGYTIEELKECERKGICNGMGGKGGIQWTNLMRALPYFKGEKEKKLLEDLDLISDIHDLEYTKGGGIIEYIKANYKLAYNIIRLLHWTNTPARIFVFIVVFLGTTFFGFRYFNWKIG